MRSTGFLRFMAYLSVALVMILTLCLGISGIYMGMNFSKLGVSDDLKGIINITSALMVANMASSWTRGIIFINFVSKSTDSELVDNRWALIVLSLGVGSIFIVSILTRFTGGYAVISDKEKNPVRFLVGRWQSMVGLFFGLAGLASFALFSFGVKNNSGMDIYLNNLTQSSTKAMFFIFVGFFVLSAFVGLIAAMFFYQKNALQKYKTEGSAARKIMIFFAVMYTCWVTILLIYAMLSALLELIQALFNAFGSQHENAFERIFAILMLPLIFYMQMYIIEICAGTLVGVWSKDDQIEFKEYKNLYKIQHPSQKTGNYNR